MGFYSGRPLKSTLIQRAGKAIPMRGCHEEPPDHETSDRVWSFPEVEGHSCPECAEFVKTHEELGVHIERHAPEKLGHPTKASDRGARVCPNGCGRQLYGSNLDSRTHVRLCDGQPRLKTYWEVLCEQRQSGEILGEVY